jgi:LysR family transcriptional regulator, hca operon transcriptional activator
MQTDHLKIFIDLAETLNFTQTSQNMHVTQPMVTQVIHSLENELNTVLFNRDSDMSGLQRVVKRSMKILNH